MDFDDEDFTFGDTGNRDVKVSMCSGLIGRIAVRTVNNERVHAANAIKEDGPFYCDECLSEAIVRKCVDKKDHFAHKGRLSKLYGSGESDLHLNCKTEILNALQEAYPDGNWAVERTLPAIKEKELLALQPDISGRINKQGVVIEVQRSFLNVKTITKRTVEYKKRGAAILWIVPIKEELGTEFFRPRLFEKFLHSMYFGKVYYWKTGYGGKILPVHFQRAERWINEQSWFDADTGEERTEGGYWKNYKTIRQPIASDGLLNIADKFKAVHANEWEPDNEKMKIPERIIFRDNLDKWWSKNPARRLPKEAIIVDESSYTS